MTDKQIIFRLDSEISKRLEDRLKEKGMTRQYLFSKVVQLFLEDKLSFDNSNDNKSNDNSLITIDSSEVEMAVRKFLPELAVMIANDNSLITEVTKGLKNNVISELSNDNSVNVISELSNDNNLNVISELSNDNNLNVISELSNDNIRSEPLTCVENSQDDNNKLSNDNNFNKTSATINTDKIDGQLSLMDISDNFEKPTQEDIQPPVTVNEVKPTENEFREALDTECDITHKSENKGKTEDSSGVKSDPKRKKGKNYAEILDCVEVGQSFTYKELVGHINSVSDTKVTKQNLIDLKNNKTYGKWFQHDFKQYGTNKRDVTIERIAKTEFYHNRQESSW